MNTLDLLWVIMTSSMENIDDTELKKSIINIYRSLLNIIDRTDFLNNYLETFFNKDKIVHSLIFIHTIR